MDQEISQKLAALEAKLEATYQSVEKLRQYFFWTLIITVLAIVLPLIGLAFAIPTFLQTLTVPGLG